MVAPLRFSAADGAGRRVSRYRELPPPAGLAPVVQCSWEGVPGWARSLRVLPDGCADLAWNGRRLVVVGAAGPVRIPLSGSGTAVGVRLRCGVAGGLLGPGFAADPVVDLHDLVRTRLVDRLSAAETPAAQRVVLTEFVERRLRNGFEPDPAMAAAVRTLSTSDIRVDAAAGRLGVSDRTLRRRVRDAVGYGPKELHRVLRFHRFLRRLDDLAAGRTTLSAIAAELGFADQSHLGHECRRLSGSSPARLVASYARHEGVAETDQTAAR
ncbi:helix-turn-helix domain-containing protein [Amycolatopsis saalfeldensis]|nr:helix-turn-helix domain-containing protein [Amycolatopsis saalfeldensis]